MKSQETMSSGNTKTERRQLTVMFCDLVGSTALSQKLDPESFHKLINEYQKLSEQVVKNLDGYVAQFLGDGVLVYFGYPKAHEDDARRAVKAGREILGQIENIDISDLKSRNRLKVRIGIHTGDVVIGEVGGSSKREHLAMGDVPNIAALIQKSAKPNEILISSSTEQLLGGFYNTKRISGARNTKSSDIIDLYRIAGEKKGLSRFEAHTFRALTPLVGRDKELNTLSRIWNEVVNRNKGRALLINGEAGVGKSRLVYEFKNSNFKQPFRVLECQCWETTRNSPFYPIVNLLERMIELEVDDSQDIRIKKIEKLLKRHKLNLKRNVPLLAHLLSIQLPSKYAMPVFAPEKLKKESVGAFIEVLAKISEKIPLAFIVEDLHWADPSTLDLLSILVNESMSLRIFSIFTCRPKFRCEWGNTTPLKLELLNNKHSEEMVKGLIGSGVDKVQSVKEIITKSDGIPLYIEEITKAIIKLGNKSDVSSIPITLNDPLMARLDNLGKAKEVAQVGALLGREFSERLLKSVLTGSRSSINTSLKILLDDEIIFLTKPGQYIFKHALIQDAAYASMSRETRRIYHKKVAEELDESFKHKKENRPELPAHHFEKAGEAKKAIEYLSLAGAGAMSKSSYIEAGRYINNGLELLDNLPRSEGKDKLEINLLKLENVALLVYEGFTSGKLIHRANRLLSLCKKQKSYDDLLPALMSMFYLYADNDKNKTFHYVRQINFYSKRSNKEEHVALSHYASACYYYYKGNYDKTLYFFDKCLDIYKADSTKSPAFFLDTYMISLSTYPLVDFHLGNINKSRKMHHAALNLAGEINKPGELIFTLLMSSLHLIFDSNLKLAKKFCERGIKISETTGINIYKPLLDVLVAYLKVNEDSVNRNNCKELERVYNDRNGLQMVRTIYYSFMAEGFCAMGDLDKAISTINECIDHDQRVGYSYFMSRSFRLKGDFLLLKSERNKKKAEDYYIQSIDIARKQKTRFFELKAAISYSKLLLNQGREKEANKLLNRIVRWFETRNETDFKEYKEAKLLLSRLQNI